MGIVLWPDLFRKSQTDFRNVFWHVFHTLIKNDAAIVATALIYALSYKQKEMAEFIIESDANVNSTINNLETLLHFALMLNHEEFVLLLLQNGASLNAMDQDKIPPIEEGLMSKQVTAFTTMIAYTKF